jgi:hypothetical protein
VGVRGSRRITWAAKYGGLALSATLLLATVIWRGSRWDQCRWGRSYWALGHRDIQVIVAGSGAPGTQHGYGVAEAMFEKGLLRTRTGFAYEWLGDSLLLAVPLWFLVGVVAPATGVAWWVGRRQVRPGCCRACGYDLRGLHAGADRVCPECGAAATGGGVTEM